MVTGVNMRHFTKYYKLKYFVMSVRSASSPFVLQPHAGFFHDDAGLLQLG
jgi:hypothetical protein